MQGLMHTAYIVGVSMLAIMNNSTVIINVTNHYIIGGTYVCLGESAYTKTSTS